MASILVNVPEDRQARRGDRDQDLDRASDGDRLPRRHQRPADPARHHHRFTCAYDGVEVFGLTLTPAIAANPFIAFTTVATQSGTLVFRWTGDNGFSAEESASITVE